MRFLRCIFGLAGGLLLLAAAPTPAAAVALPAGRPDLPALLAASPLAPLLVASPVSAGLDEGDDGIRPSERIRPALRGLDPVPVGVVGRALPLPLPCCAPGARAATLVGVVELRV